eukprot:2924720-Lingulodinium_polyedra.AAC.1
MRTAEIVARAECVSVRFAAADGRLEFLGAASALLGCCLGAVWVLRRCGFGAPRGAACVLLGNCF